MDLTIQELLVAQAIGTEVLKYLKETWTPQGLAVEAGKQALQILEEIRSVLDDDGLDDSNCFRRIEEIMSIMEKNGIYTPRHDF